MKFNTLAIHCGRDNLGEAHVPPIDLSTTYKTPDLQAATESIDAMAAGAHPVGGSIYQRLHNPTVARFESAMSQLEKAEEAISFASGMGAVSAALLAAKMIGSHVIAVRPLYGGTDHLLSSGLLGLEVSWATPETVSDHIRKDTALILCETPANPTLQLVDIEMVVQQARGVAVMVDSTFATPVLQRPLSHGATLVLHSGTKFLGGHGDVMAGVICCNSEWAQRLRQVRILTGGNLHPMAAYTLHRGLQTLSVRVNAAQSNAIDLVQGLLAHPEVKRVRFPGLKQCDPKGIVGRQMNGPGTMIAIDLDSYESASAVMASVQIFTPAVSLGSCDSLIQHPAGLTHRVVNETAKHHSDIGPGLLRISVGIEDVQDLWMDLKCALDALKPAYALSAK